MAFDCLAMAPQTDGENQNHAIKLHLDTQIHNIFVLEGVGVGVPL